MITTLNFNYLYDKPKIWSICHMHYDPFTSNNWFLKFEKIEIIFSISKNFKYHKSLIMSVFHMWMVGYEIISIFFPSNFLISLMLYKFDFGVLKFKSPLLKPNSKFKSKWLKKTQHSYKSFSTNFLDQHDIKVALHNMFEKIDSFSVVRHGFWFIWLWSHP